jgi:Fe-S-cluster containining protein
MAGARKNKAKKQALIKIDCRECSKKPTCCRRGAWADIEEAKRIVHLGLKGEFFQLERDADFPSGFRIGTSYEDEPCTFLDPDGLCSIHKIDYNLKPRICREFPYENKKLSPYARILCTVFKSKTKKSGQSRK